jgi:hypothetical protein
MARPPRHNVDYFPHYISDGKKMFVIEAKFGNDGYAVWFKILETLAKTDNHFINCNDESNLMFLAAKCRITEDRLVEIINAIVKLGELDSILWNQCNIIWSDKFIESVQDAYSKRSNDCISKMQLLTMLRGLGVQYTDLNEVNSPVNPQNSPVKPQSKVKYSIVEESKGEESKTPTLEEVKDCVSSIIFEKGISHDKFPIDELSEKFWNNYETKGWQINGQQMVKWKPKAVDWVNEHIKDPTRLLGKNHGTVSAQEAEEMDIAILKHMRDVQSEIYNNQPSENNRMRRIS